ncbi:MAG: hypothetical protein QG608_2265 [Actinomycetota bacterium]|nr:hypothetical protein [Actinomycetota bacterium]
MTTALEQIDTWPVTRVGAGLLRADGPAEFHGAVDDQFRIASVTKLLTAYAVLIGVEEGAVELDDHAGPPGATVRHLLSHAAGYGFESGSGAIASVGTRRIYSNQGFEVLSSHVERSSQIPFPVYLAEAVFEPLGMTATELSGSPAFAARSTVRDLLRFAGELMRPRLVHPDTLAQAVTVQFPGLGGVLPGVGRFQPLDWGLGFERAFCLPGHWAGQSVGPRTFGHFGGSGSFLWVDPDTQTACTVLGDREFGPWALEAWPALGDAVLSAG